jgi:hypothetical protein
MYTAKQQEDEEQEDKEQDDEKQGEEQQEPQDEMIFNIFFEFESHMVEPS